MLEGEMIDFYVGLFKLHPAITELPEKVLLARLDVVVETLFGITLTRDHVKRALQLYTGNRIKRRWDLKFEYGVQLWLKNQRLETQVVHDILKSMFNERTRPGVLDSMKIEAIAMCNTDTQEQINAFCNNVVRKFAEKNKDAPFFKI